MAAPDQDKGSFPTFNIVAIIALITGAVLFQQTGFIPKRPTTTDRVTNRFRTPQDVDARLWQDPFAAVATHREQQSKENSRERRLHPAHHSRQDVFAYLDVSQAQQLMILPVMTLGGPWPDEAEQRRRTRYAVVASLAASGFAAEDSSRVGYLDLSECADQGLPDVLPYEWFAHERPTADPRKILILWVDENAFMNEPLRKLSTVVSLVHPDHRSRRPCGMRAVELPKSGHPTSALRTTINILGPATSTGLVELARDVRNPPACARILETAHVFPSAPTIAAASVLERLGEPTSPSAEDRLVNLFQAQKLVLRRTTATDDVVATELIAELKRRHVSLEKTDSLAIITEWDTVYARELRRAVEQAACSAATERCNRGEEPKLVDVLTYTSGLDGRVPAKQPAKDTPPASSDNSEKREVRPIERADGTGQFDYLRRLAARIESKNYAAIGVLGSDTYDKLLVLQAIRPWAKQSLVFTTDLDARLLHPEEFQWAHNLIVASSFGLRLAPVIQRNTPPFRDTYQAGAFLATGLALEESSIDPHLLKSLLGKPRLFEIGRTDAWDVTPVAPVTVAACDRIADCSGVHPQTPWWRTASSEPWMTPILSASMADLLRPAHDFVLDALRLAESAMPLIVGALMGATLLALISARVRRFGGWLAKHRWGIAATVLGAAGALVLLGALIYADGMEGEPVALFEGISIWPTELLRLLVALIGGVATWRLLARARESNLQLTKKYFVNSQSEPEAERDAVLYLAQQKRRPSLRSAARDVLSWMPLRPAPSSDEPVNAEHIWRVHLEESSPWARWSRVVPLVAIYLVLGSALIWFFTVPAVPARGLWALRADRFCLASAVVSVSTLIFMVFDNIRLCDKVASALSGQQETEWPSGLHKQIGKRLGLEVDWLPSILEVRIIQEWTSWLLPMAYYPFAGIAIMLLARFSLFDNWHQSPGLLLTTAIGLMATIGSVIMLQRAARRTQTHSVRRLEKRLESMRQQLAEERLSSASSAAEATVSGSAARQVGFTRQIRRLSGHLREVREMTDGAFAPVHRLAPVRALLLPFGGAGGLAMLEYLTTWWR